MTWLNRGFKLKHKFIKEKDMKEQAIQALELFKQQHLARAVNTNEQADMVSESSDQTKENQMEQRNLGELLAQWEEGTKEADAPEENKKNINYPDHIKPLSERMLSALNNGVRTVDTVAKYCKENEKLVRLQLNLMVSRGKIGRQTTPASGITRYYPADIAKEMGILTAPKPINRKGKKAKEQKRSSYSPATQEPVRTSPLESKDYVSFLEKRVVEWQTEARKQAHEILKLKDELALARKTRDVTSEVTEVMEEVMQLRATVAYLESKLFGRK